MIKYLSLFLILVASTTLVRSATYYFGTADQSSGQHWHNTSIWWANSNNTGSHPSSISSSDDFVASVYMLRTVQSSGSSTFSGNSLTLTNGGRLLMKARYVNIANLITDDGLIANGQNDSGQAYIIDLNVTDWDVAGQTTLSSSSSARTINANVDTISGSGQLLLSGSGGDDPFNLNFTDADGYTGDIQLTDGILNFQNDLVSAGTLTLDSGTTTILDQDVTFSGVTIGSTPLAQGTYSFATLNSTYDAYFQNGGSGSITVSGGSLYQVIIDNTDSEAIKTGTWTSSTYYPTRYGSNYIHDNQENKGSKSVRYVPDIPTTDLYDISVRWPSSSSYSTNTPLTVHSADGTATLFADQRYGDGEWLSLGSFALREGTGSDMTISTEGTVGYVIADAVRFSQIEAVDIMMDNSDSSGVEFTGSWPTSTTYPDYFGSNYAHDDNNGKGTKSVRYTPDFPVSGSYEVFMWWSATSGRSEHVPVTITSSNDVTPLYVDQTKDGGQWNSLGTYTFMAGTRDNVLISTEGTTDGHVIADGMRFVRKTAEWTPDDLGDRIWLDWRAEDLADGPVTEWLDRRVGLAASQTNNTYKPVKQNGEVYFAGGSSDDLRIPHLANSSWLPHVTHRAMIIIFRVNLTGSGSGSIFAINGYEGGQRQPYIEYHRGNDTVSMQWATGEAFNSLTFPIDPDGSKWHVLVSRRAGIYHYASLDGRDINGNYGESVIEMADWAMDTSAMSPNGSSFNRGIMGDFRSSNPAIGIDSVLLIQGDLSKQDAEKLMAWGMWRRGLENQLPSQHPYRNHRPYTSEPREPYLESTTEEWNYTKDFWANASLSEHPYAGDPIDLTGWELDFQDEFNTHSVTHDVKGKGTWFAPTHPEIAGAAVGVHPGVNTSDPSIGLPGTPATYIQSNGTMTLRMQNSGGWKTGVFASVNSNGVGRTWKYPYVEVRMKTGPSSTGNTYGGWAALWLKSLNFFHNRAQTNLEYDFYEGYISDPDAHHASIHNWSAARKMPGRLAQTRRSTGNYYGTTASSEHGYINLFDDQYHTYGCMITPYWVINYLDGKEMHRFPTPHEMKQPLWLLVDLAMHGDEDHLADGIYEMTIDYIRVYQNPAYAE